LATHLHRAIADRLERVGFARALFIIRSETAPTAKPAPKACPSPQARFPAAAIPATAGQGSECHASTNSNRTHSIKRRPMQGRCLDKPGSCPHDTYLFAPQHVAT